MKKHFVTIGFENSNYILESPNLHFLNFVDRGEMINCPYREEIPLFYVFNGKNNCVEFDAEEVKSFLLNLGVNPKNSIHRNLFPLIGILEGNYRDETGIIASIKRKGVGYTNEYNSSFIPRMKWKDSFYDFVRSRDFKSRSTNYVQVQKDLAKIIFK